MNPNVETERTYTLLENVARGAISGAASSLILLPAVSYLANRSVTRRDGLAGRLEAVARRIGGADCPPVYENRPAFAEHVLVGALWGALYGAVRGTAGVPNLPTSQAYGAALTVLDQRLLPPALRVFPELGPERNLSLPFRVIAHLLYGTVTGVMFDLARMVIPGRAGSPAESFGSSAETSRFVPRDVVAEVDIVETVVGPGSASGRMNREQPGVGRSMGSASAQTERPSPTKESVGAGAGPMAGTMPSATAGRPSQTSFGRQDLVGKMVYSRDNHALGEVKKAEMGYVEIATPVVEIGPTLYVPYDAFTHCSPHGCHLNASLGEIQAKRWNEVPSTILRADAHPGISSGSAESSGENDVRIPYFDAGESARRFGTNDRA